MTVFLDFERPIADLEEKIEELRHLDSSSKVNIVAEITKLQKKADKLLEQTYSNLTPWQKVKVARHPERPQFFDYLEGLFEDFTALAGDRCFGEDQAIIGGLARFRGRRSGNRTSCARGMRQIQSGRTRPAQLGWRLEAVKPEQWRRDDHGRFQGSFQTVW